ncbi:hypothetical protein [Tropicibacter oceani]|uniref:Uncharacterized protein n=1 Tax=Tropicibacter oceani TaxID=3058420 RepID=A0ABY8QFG1_9RHOB|nr:hypothetical protein [Tropicibacter oceani]WGW03341.1 hypothetical protein QF118_15625 [Tropicibacter oceani]
MSVTEAIAPGKAKSKGVLSGDKGVLIVVALFVALVAVLTATFGLPGLAMSALATVPFIYATLILITVGK